MKEDPDRRRGELEDRIRELEAENERLRAGLFTPRGGHTVAVPKAFEPVFEVAEETVGAYFRAFLADPSQGTIEIAGERYVLFRASALSVGFFQAIRSLYAGRGEAEALYIAKTLLFDLAHVIGLNDARNFHRKMGVTDPIAKLSAGPVHFAYAGWAFVELLPECRPTPDDDFFLTYRHPFSFESDSWLRAGKSTDFPVCVMNAGYSSGWCEESFGMPLAATEIACKAKGDETCTFIMAPPHRLRQHVERQMAEAPEDARRRALYSIPTFFERKDVEERLREAVARAEAASEAKSLFLANMSHEIRTPLTGLLGMAELLLRDEADTERQRRIEAIRQSGQSLLGILNAILDFSKIEAGMMVLEPEPTDVRALLDGVGAVLAAEVEAKRLAFHVEVAPEVPPHVLVDPLRLRQVLLNLGGNAVKFTETGSVTLRARYEDPETLHVEVVDTGVGIEPAELPRLFEMFTQSDPSHARRHGGAGLGLSIARRLVEMMGGALDARSTPGRGSTFFFSLAAPAAEAIEADAPPRVRRPRLYRGRVLLAEDDRIARYVVEHLLAQLGLTVETVENGREAVMALAGTPYDLVFMDCQMPVMDGYEATTRIRQAEAEERHTPIVALTASIMKSDSARCFACGMDDFLGKPVDTQRLEAVLSRWLKPGRPTER